MTLPTNLHNIPQLKKIIVTKGIVLQPLNNSDARRILEILKADKSIRDRVSVASKLHTITDVEDEVLRYSKDKGLIRYVILKHGNPIGLVSLWRDEGYFATKPKLNDYGFGYFLDPKERGKGIVTSAVHSLMKVLSENIYVNRFVAFCEDTNPESIAVLKKLGFKQGNKTFIEPRRGWVERKYTKKP